MWGFVHVRQAFYQVSCIPSSLTRSSPDVQVGDCVLLIVDLQPYCWSITIGWSLQQLYLCDPWITERHPSWTLEAKV